MKRLALAVTLLLAGGETARADDDFWLDVITPHHKEIDQLVTKADTTVTAADAAIAAGGIEWAHDELRTAFGAMTYARSLAPDDIDVLAAYAAVSDRLGRTDDAVAALQRALTVGGADGVPPSVTGQLGTIYLRRGQLDDAIHYLELAQGGNDEDDARYTIALSNALAQRGRSREATDVLLDSVPPDFSSSPTTGGTMVELALAVRYDRIEQRSDAFETIDRIATAMQGQELLEYLDSALGAMRFAPAADRHYYLGMVYEVTGFGLEARAEFALYAATAGAPYRKRALDHIAALDRVSRAAAIAPPPVDPSLSLSPPLVLP